MTRVVILRPRPAADRTAAKAALMGMEARVHPLFAPSAVDWTPPPAEAFDAVLLTSGHGVTMAGPDLSLYASLPAYAVGRASAAALRGVGFASVIAGEGDGSAIAARIAADGHRRVLHLAGTTVAPLDAGPLLVERVAVYSMTALPPDPALIAAAAPGTILLVHSPRAGERLAAHLPADRRASLHVVAISANALAACGEGWASGQAPAAPTDDEMLALARRLCE